MFKPHMLVLLAALLACSMAGYAARSLEDVYPDDTDPLMGNYEGRWSEEEDVDPEAAAQVIPLGRDRYRVIVLSKLDMRCPPKLDIEVRSKNNRIEFDEHGFHGKIADGVFTGGTGRMKTFRMEKVTRPIPTLGAKPPEGAVVLFDGTGFDAWTGAGGWKLLDGGVALLTPDGDNLKSKQKFKDARLHIEFRLPFLPRMRGQQRGNSGVFLQDTYEVQILDSYGLEGFCNECGALYKVAAPKVNACRPPLQWQTYDIEYHAPRYDDSGKLTANPVMTVRHNGVLVHHQQEMPWITGWKEKDRLKPPPSEPLPIRLQSHHNYMQFRNIWLVELPHE